MGKYEKNHPAEDEMVDKELQDLGVRFTDRTKEKAEAEEPKQEKAQNQQGNFRAKLGNYATLVAADALMIYMCLTGKIELEYGLVALAAASAFLGGKVQNARV